MNYVEIVARQTELEAEMMASNEELQDLQRARIACAQANEDLSITHEGAVTVALTLDYSSDNKEIVAVTKGDSTINLTVEDFNEINMFLNPYNDAIFSYMSNITKEEEDDADEEA